MEAPEESDGREHRTDDDDEESDSSDSNADQHLLQNDVNTHQEDYITLYERNRVLFIMQSVLLGIGYSIIWPTLWVYMEKDFKMSLSMTKFLYGVVFVAYPIASMISAKIVEKTTVNVKILFMLLNLAEIIGHLIYSLNFHPILPFLGRFIAGFGDSFYIVVMKDMQAKKSPKSKDASSACLVAFVVGLITAQALNALTSLIPFQLGAWKLTSSNYPGLTGSILFTLMSLTMRMYLSIGENDYYHYVTPTDSDHKRFTTDISLCSGFNIIYINGFSFIQTYLITLFEIIVPMVIFERFHASPLTSIFFYAFVSVLYALILMFTLTIRMNYMMEFFVNISILFKMTALFCLIFLISYRVAILQSVLALVMVLITISVVWTNDDVLYHYLILTMISPKSQISASTTQKATARVAFTIAGVTAPFCFTSGFVYIGSTLIVLLGVFMISFIVIRVLDKRSDKVVE